MLADFAEFATKRSVDYAGLKADFVSIRHAFEAVRAGIKLFREYEALVRTVTFVAEVCSAIHRALARVAADGVTVGYAIEFELESGIDAAITAQAATAANRAVFYAAGNSFTIRRAEALVVVSQTKSADAVFVHVTWLEKGD